MLFDEAWLRKAMTPALDTAALVSAGTLTTTTTPSTPSLADIKRVVDEIAALPDPLAEHLAENGMDPKDGWVVVLDMETWNSMPGWPSYVTRSKWIEGPMAMKAGPSRPKAEARPMLLSGYGKYNWFRTECP